MLGASKVLAKVVQERRRRVHLLLAYLACAALSNFRQDERNSIVLPRGQNVARTKPHGAAQSTFLWTVGKFQAVLVDRGTEIE